MRSERFLIRDRTLVRDEWTLVDAARDGRRDGALPAGQVIVPLALWQAERALLEAVYLERGRPLGVWLEPQHDPAVLAPDVRRLALIAVNFPKFADGRGYSTAALLRTRYGFTGELRAVGDVLRDQLYYLSRVGFNAFALRADKDLNDALQALDDFSEAYQGAADQPLPLFRRRQVMVPA
ncbi:MAG: DUF934 domain-containing protein [Betaproteobacteria bacterium]|nr:DUF934 domain-containing protein [Betaproteobacteria bacterium]